VALLTARDMPGQAEQEPHLSMTASGDDSSLSDVLRKRTAILHAEAERSGIVNDILRGKASRSSYALLLRNLLPAYCELEQALNSKKASPLLAVFTAPELSRTRRIVEDLASISGQHWTRELPLLDAGERYAASVAAAGSGEGIGLIAHAYVRYFGDLSGGVMLRRMLIKWLGLRPDSLSYYDFTGDPQLLKARLRDAIDDIATEDKRALVVSEAIQAFEHNIAVSRAVQQLMLA